jgi:hypothetical protein
MLEGSRMPAHYRTERSAERGVVEGIVHRVPPIRFTHVIRVEHHVHNSTSSRSRDAPAAQLLR